MNKFILLVSVVVSLTTASFEVAAAGSIKKNNDSNRKSNSPAAGQALSASVQEVILGSTVAETSAELSTIDSALCNSSIYVAGLGIIF